MAELLFPHGGYHKGAAASTQPQNTSPDLNNVRPLDNLDDRYRGGQRPGLDRWSTVDLSEGFGSPVVALTTVTVVEVV